jgi:hypothetical protein
LLPFNSMSAFWESSLPMLVCNISIKHSNKLHE